ncbi:MAG: hypothetical protein M3383_04970 [Actinomycetota bacterium]|nr:hypothetical protein [Actinomycetota bacterium]
MDAATAIAHAQIPQTHMPQHMEALAEANRVRLARAALKRGVLSGALDAAEVVRECPWEVETMSVGELMRSQRRWGRTRTRKFLDSMNLSENRQLGRLTLRQRSLLASELDAKRGIIHS